MRGARLVPLLLAAATAVAAQQPPAAPAVEPVPVGVPVVFDGDTLFRIYGTLGPFGPSARAAAIDARLRQVADVVGSRGDTIVVVDRDTYSELSVGELVVMSVLDDDARPVGLPRPELARRHAALIERTLVAMHASLTTRALVGDAARAVVATLVLVLLLLLMRWGFPRIHRRIEALRRVRLPAVRIQQFELLSAGRLSSLLAAAARLVRIVLTLLLFYVYVPLVLSFFPWTAALSHRIVGYAVGPFAVAWTAFVAYLPNLFYLVAGIVIARYVLAFLHLIFEAIGSGAIVLRGFYPDWAEPTYKIVRVLVLAFVAMALYPFVPGANSDAFKGVSIFLGVLFSLGSSAAIGNMVAGVVLTYTRAFQLGDRVRIGDTIGDVTEKTLLVTRLRTIKNVAVTIPNGTVLSSQVVNYTTLAAERGLILHTAVTIGYDAPWRQVESLLVEAARRTEGILAEPSPFVLQTSLDDFYVRYELNAYTDRPDRMALTYSGLHQSIQETFNAADVEIMSPHYAALRDGNQTTVPTTGGGAAPRAPSFQFRFGGAAEPPPG